MMHTVFKKLTSLVLVAFMVLSMVPIFAVTANAATGDTYQLVTDAGTLAVGDTIIIVARDSNVALSKTQNSNNRGQVNITKSGDTITGLNTAVQTITLEAGKNTGTFAFKVDTGYLYAASSSKNYLKTQTTLDANGSWTITIGANGVATVKANGSYTRNLLQYNKSSSIFSCYSSNQQGISIYKLEPSCSHTNTEAICEAKEATCTEDGCTAGSKCSDCGEILEASVTIPATGHIDENNDSICDHCGANLCTNHIWKEVVLTDATCTEAGSKQQVCENCGEIGETLTIPATGHTEVTDAAVDATCTATGLTEGKHCSVCNEVLVAQEVISKIPHNYENGECTVCHEKQPTKITINRDSFGNASGYAWHGWTATATTGETVSGAGYIYGTKTESIQMNTNQTANYIYNTDALPGSIVSIKLTAASGTKNFDVWTSNTSYGKDKGNLTVTDATKQSVSTEGTTWEFTTTDRYFVIVLDTGGAAYLSSVEITYKVCSHENTEPICEAKEATCTEDGCTAGRICSDCGEILEESATIPATGHKDENNDSICDNCGANLCTNHTWKEVVLTDATCTEAGSKQQVCENCGEIGETLTIPATGHTEVIDAAVDATCTATGLTEGKHCSVCNEVLVAQTVIPIIDHIYENGECTMCGKSEPVLPFKIGDTVIFTGSKADGTDTHELTGFADGEKYGTATGYSDTVACTFPIEVVAGYENGTYAFKNGDSYITCNALKNVNLSTTLDAKSSWKVELENNELVIKSCSNETYCLQYNPSSPRFTTYTNTQQPIKVLVIPVEKWNITLKDDLSVNFYLKLKVNDKVNFIFNEKTVTCDASELTLQADGTYLVTVNMAAAQMTDTITIQVEGSSVKKTYSIRQYADAILGSEKFSETTKALVNEMLNYGGMAQAFFGYKTGDLANAGITGAGATPVPKNAASDMNKENDSDGCITYYGASLLYRDKIAVRFYFDAVEGQNLTFMAADKVCEPVLTGGHYMIEVPDICPQDYDTQITVTVTNADGHTATVSYGPMNYIVRMYYKEGATQEMQNLLQALYNYHLAAKAYVSAA